MKSIGQVVPRKVDQSWVPCQCTFNANVEGFIKIKEVTLLMHRFKVRMERNVKVGFVIKQQGMIKGIFLGYEMEESATSFVSGRLCAKVVRPDLIFHFAYET